MCFANTIKKKKFKFKIVQIYCILLVDFVQIVDFDCMHFVIVAVVPD